MAAVTLAADQGMSQGPQSWTESPYRNFRAPRAILDGRVLVADEADDPALTAALARDLRALQGHLHGGEGWRSPLGDGDPLRIYVARKEAGGVR
ncbi:MAG TPA: hypothetical protein VJ776_10055, partial [Thermoanaerobaculia bacterium]|nr:hypothetical protein [Thermoanaerobaculia bacterium]